MGLSKVDKFTTSQNSIAAIAKALGHPARIAIIEYLMEEAPSVCGDIVKQLPLAQATVSQHLKELKKVGIITGKVEGTSVCYCIHAENWRAYKEQWAKFFEQKITTL